MQYLHLSWRGPFRGPEDKYPLGSDVQRGNQHAP